MIHEAILKHIPGKHGKIWIRAAQSEERRRERKSNKPVFTTCARAAKSTFTAVDPGLSGLCIHHLRVVTFFSVVDKRVSAEEGGPKINSATQKNLCKNETRQGEGCKSQTEIIFFRRIENSKMACGVEVHVYIVTQNTVRWLQWRRRTKGRTHRTDGRRGKHVFPDSWRCGKEEMENIGWTCLADYQLAPNLFLKVNHKMKIWIMKKK